MLVKVIVYKVQTLDLHIQESCFGRKNTYTQLPGLIQPTFSHPPITGGRFLICILLSFPKYKHLESARDFVSWIVAPSEIALLYVVIVVFLESLRTHLSALR